MPIDFQRQRVAFPSLAGEPQNANVTFVFPTEVFKAESAINGFDIGFSSRDRELHWLQINTHVGGTPNNTVEVRVDFRLRDRSGTYDDPYEGWVDVLVIADRA